MKTSLKKLPKSQVEIEIEISAEEFNGYIDHALLHLQEHIKVDGFRQGQVPKKILEEKVGEENLLMEAGDLAVKDSYSKFVLENNIEPISKPEVQILKVAKGNPFSFKIKTTILPDIKLADYRKIASQIKKKEISVSQEEIDDSLEYIRKSRAKFSQLDSPAQEKDFVQIEYESPQIKQFSSSENQGKIKDEFILGEGRLIHGFEKNIVGMKAGEEKEFSLVFPKDSPQKDLSGKEVNFKVKLITVQKVELPELNDDFAKSIGKFDNLDSLRKNVKEGIAMEKEVQEKQRKRSEILERIADKSEVEIPEVLVESEKERIFNNFQEKITQNFKITFKEYLASIKDDEQTLKNSFLKEAEKKVKNFLILREIGKKENILVEEKEIEEEANKMMKNYSIDVVKKIDINELKEYIKEVIYSEKVFEKLECQ